MNGYYSNFEGYSRRELRQALKRADKTLFDKVLKFLEDDPNTFGSGYSKAMIWRYIRRYELDENSKLCLENTVINNYLKRPMQREFKRMCQTMSYIGSDNFWEVVESYIRSDNKIEKINSYCLSFYSKGLQAGETKRLELKARKRKYQRQRFAKSKRHYRYPDDGNFYFGDHIWNILQNESMWVDKQIIYREPLEKDIPIVRRQGYDKLATLDYQYCRVPNVIEKLEFILWDGTYYDITTVGAWCYIFYIFGELGSIQALATIEYFYLYRIEHKFGSATKWYIVQSICRALERIDSPKARQMRIDYQYPNNLLHKHLITTVDGWFINEIHSNKGK
ncbi:MAG: hypothetical protein Phog2KO_38560 [Phototrophicaceae bacterium]